MKNSMKNHVFNLLQSQEYTKTVKVVHQK